MREQNGFLMISVVLIALLVFTLFGSFAIMTIREEQFVQAGQTKVRLRYLAEAGLSYGAYRTEQSSWNTDMSGPPAAALKQWLLLDASNGGSQGYSMHFEKGGIKVVKIAGHAELYSIGFIGDEPASARYKMIIKEEAGKRSIL